MQLFAAASVALASALCTSAAAQSVYALDDGQPNSGIACSLAADYCWLQAYTTAGDEDAIVKVRVMFQPGSIPAGTRIAICVWDDPNDDGNPVDAVLAARTNSIVPAVRELRWTDYELPEAGAVRGGFFLGAYLTTDGCAAAVGLLDTDATVQGRAWYAVTAPGQFEPQVMVRNNPCRIETLGSGVRGVHMLRGEGVDAAPATYCSGSSDAAGCRARISWLGVPSASAGTGFHVQASGAANRVPGTLLYSVHGRATVPFAGGTLCIAPPVRRTPARSSGGHAAGADCSGVQSFDFGAWIRSGIDPSLVAGTTVTAQWYSRDAARAAPLGIGLSDAVEFTLVP